MTRSIAKEMQIIEGLLEAKGLQRARWNARHSLETSGWAVGHMPPRLIRVGYLSNLRHDPSKKAAFMEVIEALKSKYRDVACKVDSQITLVYEIKVPT